MRPIQAVAAAAVALLLLVPSVGGSSNCAYYYVDGYPCGCPLTDIAGKAYIVVDTIMSDGYLYGIWVYAESNGEAGLQRGGADVLGNEDPCDPWTENPDFLIL